jgi:hypothetical protein
MYYNYYVLFYNNNKYIYKIYAYNTEIICDLFYILLIFYEFQF